MLDSAALLPSLPMLTQAIPYCRTRAAISCANQYYASYSAATMLLTDTTKILQFGCLSSPNDGKREKGALKERHGSRIKYERNNDDYCLAVYVLRITRLSLSPEDIGRNEH